METCTCKPDKNQRTVDTFIEAIDNDIEKW